MNHCTTCNEDFGSVSAFDTHRVGKFIQTGTGEYTGAIEDWTPDKGRRCLDAEEMESSGRFLRNSRGTWSLTASLTHIRERFSEQPLNDSAGVEA